MSIEVLGLFDLEQPPPLNEATSAQELGLEQAAIVRPGTSGHPIASLRRGPCRPTTSSTCRARR